MEHKIRISKGNIMKEIKCPICNRMAKFTECICNKNGRKRIMLYFPCCHFSSLVYNVSYSTDNNTIIKDFQFISKDYFNKSRYMANYDDRYLN